MEGGGEKRFSKYHAYIGLILPACPGPRLDPRPFGNASQGRSSQCASHSSHRQAVLVRARLRWASLSALQGERVVLGAGG